MTWVHDYWNPDNCWNSDFVIEKRSGIYLIWEVKEKASFITGQAHSMEMAKSMAESLKGNK